MSKLSLKDNKTKLIIIILLLLFVVASIVVDMFSIKKALKDDDAASTELEQISDYEDGVEILRYVNDRGETTFAGDKGYAVIIRERDEENRIILERYLDENEAPVVLKAGYSVIEYSYTDNTRTTYYLDSDLNPVTIDAGYSIIVRTSLSDETRDHQDMYYDSNMNPVRNNTECYGIVRLYDGNNNIESYWVDSNGNPMNSKNGDCRTVRTFNEDNRVETEMYYDAEGNPAHKPNGEYGIAITYNEDGKRETVTSLDSNGEPTANVHGYSVISYTYNRYGRIATERYYDVDGNPCATGKGWYGKRLDGDRVYYLTASGSDLISLDSILNNNPILVLIFGLIVCVMIIFAPRKLKIAVVIAYFIFIMYETIFFRVSHDTTANFELFWSYKQFFTNKGLRMDILNNIWLFVPYSLGLLSVIKNKKIVAPLLLLPLAIETAQYVFGIGLSELDDLVSNGLGELIGIGIWYLTRGISFDLKAPRTI